jgi:predicted nuclease with TOPRIM domain
MESAVMQLDELRASLAEAERSRDESMREAARLEGLGERYLDTIERLNSRIDLVESERDLLREREQLRQRIAELEASR